MITFKPDSDGQKTLAFLLEFQKSKDPTFGIAFDMFETNY